VLVAWVLPYGLFGVYDFLLGQEFLSKTLPTLSQFFPDWLPLVWFIVGFIAFIFVTFEGAYRISRRGLIKGRNPSVASGIIAVSNYGYEFEVKDDSLRLRLLPEIHAIPGVRVEDIHLEMKGKRFNTDWKPMDEAISGDIGGDVYVDLPRDFKHGIYQVRIVAIIENGEHLSDPFKINYQKLISDREGSQT